MVAVPASGVSSVTRILNSVVLPPPSGPMNPNSSPDRTSNDTPSRAVFEANFLTTLSAVTAVVIAVARSGGSLRESEDATVHDAGRGLSLPSRPLASPRLRADQQRGQVVFATVGQRRLHEGVGRASQITFAGEHRCHVVGSQLVVEAVTREQQRLVAERL